MPTSQRTVFLGVAVAGLIAVAVCVISWRAEHGRVGDWGFPLDDTWIHAQIARNLVQGHGWSFNPGVSVQNSSGPLWTAIIAIGFAIAGPNVWVVKILASLCLLGCITLAARLAWLQTQNRLGAIAAAFLTATSAPLTWHALSGMETTLAALLVIGALTAFVRWKADRKRFTWPGLVALAVMTRPETLALFPIFVFEQWRLHRRAAKAAPAMMTPPPPWWRDALIACCIAGAILLPYFILNLHLSGSFFPTTFGAKAGKTGLGSALRERDFLELLLSFTVYPYTWAVHTLTYWGRVNFAVLLTGVVGAWVATRGPAGTLAPALLLVALPVLRGTAAPYALPSIHDGRYIGCLLPVLYVCATVGLANLFRKRESALATTRRVRLIALGVALVALAVWVRLELRVPHVGPEFWSALPGMVFAYEVPKSISATLQQERFGLFLAVTIPLAIIALGLAGLRSRRVVAITLAMLAVGFQLQRLPRLPPRYAQHVHEIHAMDVELGRWVKTNISPGTKVAVNDIGAIAYFGERPIVDVIGLATPELTPYWSRRRLLTLVGLRRIRPSVCIIFPSWFPSWLQMASLFVPLHERRVDKMTIIGDARVVIYRLDWDRFERYYTDAMIERLDPPEAHASLGGHLRRGLGNLGVLTLAGLHASAGDFLREQKEFGAAERHYRRAIELDPSEISAWGTLLRLLDDQKRNDARMEVAHEMARHQPESAVALEVLGQCEEREGLFGEALTHYTRALALRPDNLRLLRKAEHLMTAYGDLAAAQEIRRRRVELEQPMAR